MANPFIKRSIQNNSKAERILAYSAVVTTLPFIGVQAFCQTEETARLATSLVTSNPTAAPFLASCASIIAALSVNKAAESLNDFREKRKELDHKISTHVLREYDLPQLVSKSIYIILRNHLNETESRSKFHLFRETLLTKLKEDLAKSNDQLDVHFLNILSDFGNSNEIVSSKAEQVFLDRWAITENDWYDFIKPAAEEVLSSMTNTSIDFIDLENELYYYSNLLSQNFDEVYLRLIATDQVATNGLLLSAIAEIRLLSLDVIKNLTELDFPTQDQVASLEKALSLEHNSSDHLKNLLTNIDEATASQITEVIRIHEEINGLSEIIASNTRVILSQMEETQRSATESVLAAIAELKSSVANIVFNRPSLQDRFVPQESLITYSASSAGAAYTLALPFSEESIPDELSPFDIEDQIENLYTDTICDQNGNIKEGYEDWHTPTELMLELRDIEEADGIQPLLIIRVTEGKLLSFLYAEYHKVTNMLPIWFMISSKKTRVDDYLNVPESSKLVRHLFEKFNPNDVITALFEVDCPLKGHNRSKPLLFSKLAPKKYVLQSGLIDIDYSTLSYRGRPPRQYALGYVAVGLQDLSNHEVQREFAMRAIATMEAAYQREPFEGRTASEVKQHFDGVRKLVGSNVLLPIQFDKAGFTPDYICKDC